MIIIMQVNAPLHMAQGIKEAIAMHVEKFGDTKVVEILEEEKTTQEKFEQWKNG